MSERRPKTNQVRGGLERSAFGETAEALYLTSGYVYETAEDAAAIFKGDRDGYIYSRYGNPTVSVFEERSAPARRCRSLPGDRQRDGCCLRRLGLQPGVGGSGRGLPFTVWVHAGRARNAPAPLGHRYRTGRRTGPRRLGSRPDERRPRWCFSKPLPIRSWRSSTLPRSPNERTQRGPWSLPTMCLPPRSCSRPIELGADVVVYSTTKHLDGQGRTMGGAVLGSLDFIDGPFKEFQRHTGPTMSAFQCLGSVQEPRNARSAGYPAINNGSRVGRVRRKPAGSAQDAVSNGGFTSAGRPGPAADVARRLDGGRRTGRAVEALLSAS